MTENQSHFPHVPEPEESDVPTLEEDETIAPRPEEEIADLLRAEPDLSDHTSQRWRARLERVRQAVHGLQVAAREDGDAPREQVAERLDARFADIPDRRTMRRRAQESLALYRGGMGSFQDVGTANMSAAVRSLYQALRRSARRW